MGLVPKVCSLGKYVRNVKRPVVRWTQLPFYSNHQLLYSQHFVFIHTQIKTDYALCQFFKMTTMKHSLVVQVQNLRILSAPAHNICTKIALLQPRRIHLRHSLLTHFSSSLPATAVWNVIIPIFNSQTWQIQNCIKMLILLW